MPFGGALIAAGSALIPAVIKGVKGVKQKKLARKLKQVDVTPEAFKEKEGMDRMAAANQRLPGQDQEEARINQATANTMTAASQGATTSTGLLGAITRSNTSRLAALGNLSMRVEANRQQQRLILGNTLNRKAGYQEQSRAEFNNAKSSLSEAGDRNIFSAAQDVANAGAFTANEMAGGNPAGFTSDYTGGAGNYWNQQRLRRKIGKSPLAPSGTMA